MKSPGKIFLLLLISQGFTSVITQIILLREFLKIFYGNELIVGIVLANWMLITGIGSFTAKYFTRKEINSNTIFIFQFIISFLPLITFIVIKPLRFFLFPYGAGLSILTSFIFSLILLIPYCFMSGILFAYLCNKVCAIKNDNEISRAYSLDITGSIAGGLLFNFILIFFLEPARSFLILTIVNLIVSYLLSKILNKNIFRFITISLIPILIALIFFPGISDISNKSSFRQQQIIESNDNYLGNITVTKSAEQYNFFENGMLLFSGNEVIGTEESVHYAMCQHRNPQKVLLISGGVSGTLNEIIKYKPVKIDYIEINPYLLKSGKKYIHQDYDYHGLSYIQKDPFIFLRHNPGKYDVILINLPEPYNAWINRYYSIEFFTLLKFHAENDCVVSAGLTATEDYISKNEVSMHSVLYSTMKKCFSHIIIINGQKNYFLASDNILSFNIGDKISSKGILNSYVNNDYMDNNLIAERGQYIEKNLNKNAGINTCLHPVCYYYQLLHWFDQFGTDYRIILALLVLILIIILSTFNYIDFALFTGGFSSISAEIIMVITFQVIYGYMFRVLGIIITLFFVGMAIGSSFVARRIKNNMKNFIVIQLLIACYFIITPFFIFIAKDHLFNELLIMALFVFLTLSISILTGLEFSISTSLKEGELLSKAGKLYSSDMFGSAIGALIISAFLIPLAGIFNVCIMISLLSTLSAVICFFKFK